jgi:hypothetical protein
MLIELSAAAAGICGRATRSGTSDWYAGMVRTAPEPSRKINRSNSAGGI